MYVRIQAEWAHGIDFKREKSEFIPFNSHIHNGHNSVCFQVPKLVDVFESDLILYRLLLTETKTIDFIDGIPTKHKLSYKIFLCE